MLGKFPQEKEDSGVQSLTYSCHSCCFYREIELESRKLRLLCVLIGEKRPVADITQGCNVIPGQWRDIDRILDLPKSRVFGHTVDPNIAKRGNRFSRSGRKIAKKDIFAIDDFSVNPISHIAEKRKGSLVRLGYREAQVARNARERA